MPSPEMHTIRAMAKVGFECHREQMREMGESEPDDYEPWKDHWYLAAKQMYCVLAKLGGARVEYIKGSS